MISHLSEKDMYGSTIAEITGRRLLIANWYVSGKNCPRNGSGRLLPANS